MIGRSMASFLSGNPGVTTGPAGIVHSVKLPSTGYGKDH